MGGLAKAERSEQSQDKKEAMRATTTSNSTWIGPPNLCGVLTEPQLALGAAH